MGKVRCISVGSFSFSKDGVDIRLLAIHREIGRHAWHLFRFTYNKHDFFSCGYKPYVEIEMLGFRRRKGLSG
jgi:hypothetical protein